MKDSRRDVYGVGFRVLGFWARFEDCGLQGLGL